MRFWRLLVLSLLISTQFLLTSCSVLDQRDPQVLHYADMSGQSMKPEEAKAFFGDVAKNWFYGQGLGRTAVHTGAAIAFPPYALVLLGNSVLTVGGYQPIGVSTFLPEEREESWEEVCDLIYSGPGRVTAAIANKQYRTKELAAASLQKYIKKPEPEGGDSLLLEEIL